MRGPLLQKNGLDTILAAFPQIKAVILVVNDKQATQYLKEYAEGEIVLVATYATSRAGGIDEDNVQEKDNMWLFAVKNMNPKDYTHDVFLTLMQEMFVLMASIKRFIVDNSIFNGKINMITEPEYEAFNSDWNGYSSNVNYDTIGFNDEHNCN